MHTDRVTVARHRFASLHESGSFVMPNPWDRGSARLLASMGFEALATSSAGLSFALDPLLKSDQ